MLHRSKIAPKIETSINSQISLHFPIRSLLPGQHRSPPLSRGIPAHLSLFRFLWRIIPALAGNTIAPLALAGNVGDHPRSRGEYPRQVDTPLDPGGSSPLSRGIRCACPSTMQWPGIIPALAGNTQGGSIEDYQQADHPRSRGEYTLYGHESMECNGSSPLSRGIRKGIHPLPSGPGIIPALAGNTAPSRSSPTPSTDHPRSRGEYVVLPNTPKDPIGSSPLSRGIQPPEN